MSYQEKLKDPRWQKKRLEILQRDKWTCRFCGEKEKTLHVHHLFYFKDRDPWDIDNGFLLTLCEDCHSVRPLSEEEAGLADAGKTNLEIYLEELACLLDTMWAHGYQWSDLLEIAGDLSKITIPSDSLFDSLSVSIKKRSK
jgi:hypothetical protein